jgi:hypothetical protein
LDKGSDVFLLSFPAVNFHPTHGVVQVSLMIAVELIYQKGKHF